MFKLTPEIIDQIIFAMEDQENSFVVNPDTGGLAEVRDDDESLKDEKYIEIPEWRPVDGYRLMESFISGLHNPIYRQQLLDAIASGRKVFRNFKNSLKGNAVLERKWFLYKERELKRIIYEWYNTNREIQGLKKIQIPAAETEDLVLSDFVFTRWHNNNPAIIAELDRKAVFGWYKGFEPEVAEKLYNKRISNLPDIDDKSSIVFTAQTPSDETAGFIWVIKKKKTVINTQYFLIVQLYVIEEYRGLGIAKALLKHLVDFTLKENINLIDIALPDSLFESISIFESFGFRTVSKTLELNMEQL
ncbi:MAG: GNAT family N-acetyltransferase [Spirochaetes bacterium]|nr:GNAT family N-acetyltransferase [Spirochaetota bacterium]